MARTTSDARKHGRFLGFFELRQELEKAREAYCDRLCVPHLDPFPRRKPRDRAEHRDPVVAAAVDHAAAGANRHAADAAAVPRAPDLGAALPPTGAPRPPPPRPGGAAPSVRGRAPAPERRRRGSSAAPPAAAPPGRGELRCAYV